MLIDEGGLPVGGSLLDLVQFKGRTAQEARAETAARLEEQKKLALERYIEQTEKLREYLRVQASLVDEVLNHFQVRQLLEELKRNFWSDAVITPLLPPIYNSIVNHPESLVQSFVLKQGTGKESEVGLNELVDPENFSKMIPRVEGYGIAISRGFKSTIGKEEWTKFPGMFHYSAHPGYGSYSDPSTYYWVKKPGETIPVSVKRTIAIESVASQSIGSNYDLIYSYRSDRRDLSNRIPRGVNNTSSQDGSMYVTPRTRIRANQQPEAIKELIAEQVFKEKHGQLFV